MLRQQATAIVRSQARLFATSTVAHNKGPADAVKDTAKKVDRTISDAAVKGIDKAAGAAESAKEAAGMGAAKAKEQAQEAGQKAQEVKEKAADEAKEKAKEVKADAQSKK